MPEKPCEKERKAVEKALNELGAASGAYGRFIVTEPLDPLKEPAPMSFEEMRAASDRLRNAEQAFHEANESYLDCLGVRKDSAQS